MNNEPENKLDESPRAEGTALKAAKWLYDIVEIFTVAVIVVVLVFAFFFRMCRVDGRSMNNTLAHGELIVTSSFLYEPEQGDIVVFHLINDYYAQPLVKRVIAKEGQSVKIDLTDAKVYIDGALIEENYVFLENGKYDPMGYFDPDMLETDEDGHTVFYATVPEGKLFVMGDNRNHSSDSRTFAVGFVDKSCVLGKAVFRLSPFTSFN